MDVITGTIKANFPTRISFQVTSKIDSRTILGEQGAEQLLGQGDMLYMAGGGRITRLHGPFVSDDEVEVVAISRRRASRTTSRRSPPAPTDEDGAVATSAWAATAPATSTRAVAVVTRDRKASTCYIQRRLQIGYNRAASLMERMEQEGVVGPREPRRQARDPGRGGRGRILGCGAERRIRRNDFHGKTISPLVESTIKWLAAGCFVE